MKSRADENATGMRQLTATFHVSTPLFLGDAAQEPELLGAPFKRALRFWWRALNYRYVTDGEHPFKELQEREGRLFGRAADDRYKEDGRCPFTLRVSSVVPVEDLRRRPGEVLGEARGRPGLIYLGYGLIHQGRLARGCLWVTGGFDIRLELCFPRRQELPDDLAQELVDAVKVFGLLGGIGGRNRRGFGSVSLVRLETDRECGLWSVPVDNDGYQAELLPLLRHTTRDGGGTPLAFTAFGRDSRIDLMGERDVNACALLDGFGRIMQRYRSWGRNGMVGGQPREEPFRFTHDHDWYLAWRYAKPNQIPQPAPPLPARAVFGLPQPYTQTLRMIGPCEDGKDIDRRASPLLIHIHSIGEQYAVVAALLPAQFLPNNRAQVVYAGANAAHPYPQTFNENLNVIRDFLDGAHRGGVNDGEPYFPDSAMVWPP